MTVTEQLEAAGYIPLADHPRLRPGMRVRHIGHQWPEAIRTGTATITAVLRKPASKYEQLYGTPDIELAIAHDDGTESQWADYHCVAVDPAYPVRPFTEPVQTGTGSRVKVHRCCDGCNRDLGDATPAELEAAVAGQPLPSVIDECGCQR